MERRQFLQSLVATLPGVMLASPSSGFSDRLGDVLPQRVLGRTGQKVTMLGLGGYHIGWTSERDAQETIEAALEGGIRFFDTAESYDNGRSEERYGRFLVPDNRDQVFIMTKTTGRDAATVQRHLDDSLRRLKTDYLDLWQVHSLESPEDVDQRIANGVLDVFEKARSSGKTRFIGFTGHRDPAAHQRMLERTRDRDIFDTAQMPINVLDASNRSFIQGVVPRLQERNIGLLAMKTLADGRFFTEKRRFDQIEWSSDKPVIPDRLTIQQALHFVWSLPVSVLITGAENATLVREKIGLARRFVEMDPEDRQELIDRVADLAEEGQVEYFKG